MRFLLLSLFVALVYSHAALTNPPARNAVGNCTSLTDCKWCPGVYCLINYDWMSANKGDQTGDWTNAGTNMCGNADFITPSPTVVATYQAGSTIDLTISINAFHQGYYEFRLCVPDLVTDMPPSTNQGMLSCLTTTRTPLLRRLTPLQAGQIASYKIATTPVWTTTQLATRWRQDPEDGTPAVAFRGGRSYTLTYVLPSDVQCDHCVLHWYWQSLNSYQTGDATTTGTTQGERFWNCADIAITNPNGKAKGILTGFLSGSPNPIPTPVPVPSRPIPTPTPTPIPVSVTTPTPVPVSSRPTPVSSTGCGAVSYGDSPSIWWTSVIGPNSPLTITCSDGTTRSCVWDDSWKRHTCTFTDGGQGACQFPHKAQFANGQSCSLSTTTLSNAATTESVTESSQGSNSATNTQDGSSISSGSESTPGWAIALLVLGSLTIVGLVVAIVAFTRGGDKSERF